MRQHLIKSTNCFRVMMALAVILWFGTPAAAANNSFVFQAQITDSQTLEGDISIQLARDYTQVDVYIALNDTQNRLFTLAPQQAGGYGFSPGVHRLASLDRLSAAGWGFIQGIDFSQIAMADGDVVMLAVICPVNSRPVSIR